MIKQSNIIILVAAAAVLGFIAWSLWAELDQITRAPGTVVPSGRIQIVQSSEGGITSQMLVREGDRVRKGQLLVVLDKVNQTAAVQESVATLADLKSQMARIQAELFNRPLVFSADIRGNREFIANQTALYHQRRRALQAELKNLDDMLKLVRQELDMNMPLVDSGDVSRSEVLRMQRTVADLEGQITNRRNVYLQELQTEYARIQGELATAEQAFAQRQQALEQAELYAPTDGVVVNVKYTTIGAVLKPGDEVLQIVPTRDTLIVEARVPPADIAFVRKGQEASVKFDAYDTSIYGAAQGRVTYVSADTLTEETPDGPVSYYAANLEVDTSKMRPRHAGDVIEIQPGMTATAEIKTGESTVFRYLTKPILKTTGEALGER
ncbi:HlyD family efflux transporter periplasmic adaptor subunit [Croceicoccus sp. F390]|uniref:HlyD family efflux transporter periplasmic adaptor subunit n=1 Tax=Croceicoccus esteveae TaxID=3075597 RepID=A0ABU2ZP25_9SPHN|nr:HlyD family efflux transporter periplasmic adaptor subunit [Croceicoccus sp. F390]MDT0577172.1 HlyD family efflux transporter periplasmic adaptor subunit [Croceicoccus sp. F390]